jgi:class 3 adenylate cyclase
VLAVFDAAADGAAAATEATRRVAAHATARVAPGTDLVLAVRVGVATGPVRTLTVDLGRRRVRRISGETVARASALEAGAPPGGALVDGPTRAGAGLPDGYLEAFEGDGLSDAYRLVGEAPAAVPLDGSSTGPHDDREERRTIYAVFVGLVAAPGAADPDELLASAAEPVAALVERFGGTVKDAAGASVVAMFGAPVAHEDDAERAVAMALEAVHVAVEAGVAARVGVASGVVVVGQVGSGRQAE